MTKVLFISHVAGRSGAPIGVLALMAWLRANTGYEMGALLLSPGPLVPSFRALGPTAVLGTSWLGRSRWGRRVRKLLPRHLRDEVSAMRRLYAAGSYDIIFSSTIMTGRALSVLARFGAPVVTHVHELEYWITRGGPENFRQVSAQTKAYIAASRAVKDNLVSNHGLAAADIEVIHEHIRNLPPVATEAMRSQARQALGLPATAFVIGGCGGEYWRKGRDLVPQLLLAVRRRAPELDVHLVWIGAPGSPEDEFHFRHDMRAAGLEGRFHAPGEVEDPLPFYAAMDVFALVSRDDPYPLACLEAAAAQRPVVCFEGAGGMPEFVEGGCGLAVPYLDVAAMADALCRLARDPALARRYGAEGRNKVARENTLATTAPRIQRVIERSLAPLAAS